MCQGFAQVFGPSLFYIFNHTKLTTEEIVSILLGYKCLGPTTESAKRIFDSSNLNWDVEIPPPPVDNSNATSGHNVTTSLNDGSKTFRLYQLSDVHLDLTYTPGSSVKCGDPLCCRINNMSLETGHQCIKSSGAGYWGEQEGYCDAPLRLADQVIEKFNHAFRNRNPLTSDLIFWGGDIHPHDSWETTKFSLMRSFKIWTRIMKSDMFGLNGNRGKVFLPILGNNDGYPSSQFSWPEVTDDDVSTNFITERLSQLWGPWLASFDETALNTFRQFGYYSVLINPDLRIIALQTNFCSRFNYWQFYDSKDPGDQIKWLISQLRDSEQKNQKVYILGHHPISSLFCTENWTRIYLKVLKRFKDLLVASFYGHTHLNEARIYYDDDDTDDPIHVGFTGASLTPFGHVNPGYDVYTMDHVSKVVLDHETVYYDVHKANHKRKTEFISECHECWSSFGSDRMTYDVENLSLESWCGIYQKLQSNKSLSQTYFEKYHRRSQASDWSSCDDSCVTSKVLSRIKVSDPID